MTAPVLEPDVTLDVLALELLPEVEAGESAEIAGDVGDAGCALGWRAPSRASAG